MHAYRVWVLVFLCLKCYQTQVKEQKIPVTIQPRTQMYGCNTETTTTYGANVIIIMLLLIYILLTTVGYSVIVSYDMLESIFRDKFFLRLTYRWYSIFVLLCSCFLCGLVALIYSVKVIIYISSYGQWSEAIDI